jgi:hypothetical protein
VLPLDEAACIHIRLELAFWNFNHLRTWRVLTHKHSQWLGSREHPCQLAIRVNLVRERVDPRALTEF